VQPIHNKIVKTIQQLLQAIMLSLAMGVLTHAALNAQNSASQSAAKRTHAMEQIAAAMKRLTSEVQSQSPLATDQIFEDAEIIEIYARTFGNWFVPGATTKKTAVNPTVWGNLEEVDRLSHELADIALELQSQADQIQPDQLAEFVKKLAASCRSCHRQYKQRN
jgi:cytochrome c556